MKPHKKIKKKPKVNKPSRLPRVFKERLFIPMIAIASSIWITGILIQYCALNETGGVSIQLVGCAIPLIYYLYFRTKYKSSKVKKNVKK